MSERTDEDYVPERRLFRGSENRLGSPVLKCLPPMIRVDDIATT